MLIALALSAALQPGMSEGVRVGPSGQFRVTPSVRSCARDGLEHARNAGVLYREGDRPAEQRRLDELPDADMVLTVLKRDGSGCALVDVVRRGVSTPERPPIVGVPLQRTPSLRQQGRPERQR